MYAVSAALSRCKAFEDGSPMRPSHIVLIISGGGKSPAQPGALGS